MIDTYPGGRMLVAKTYLRAPADLDAWYGGAREQGRGCTCRWIP